MSMRIVKSARRTDETEISLTLNLDGSGIYDVDTGCGFLNHMLELFSRHGRFDLTLACRGDVQVDYHHTVEDIAIVLGRASSEALGVLRRSAQRRDHGILCSQYTQRGTP